jgi:hypothetical protein
MVRRGHLVAEALPLRDLLQMGVAKPVANRAQGVRAVGHGLLGFGQQALEPAVACVVFRSRIHSPRV